MVYFFPFIAAVDPGPDGSGGVLDFLLTVNLILNGVPCLLTALALLAVARNWGISRPWLALIPVADLWVLGKIVDTYNLHCRKRKKNMRCLLPALGLGALLGPLLMGAVTSLLPELPLWAGLLLSYGAVGIWGVFLIQRYIALCDLYRSGTTGREGRYMVLSVFFPFLIPYFVFASR